MPYGNPLAYAADYGVGQTPAQMDRLQHQAHFMGPLQYPDQEQLRARLHQWSQIMNQMQPVAERNQQRLTELNRAAPPAAGGAGQAPIVEDYPSQAPRQVPRNNTAPIGATPPNVPGNPVMEMWGGNVPSPGFFMGEFQNYQGNPFHRSDRLIQEGRRMDLYQHLLNAAQQAQQHGDDYLQRQQRLDTDRQIGIGQLGLGAAELFGSNGTPGSLGMRAAENSRRERESNFQMSPEGLGSATLSAMLTRDASGSVQPRDVVPLFRELLANGNGQGGGTAQPPLVQEMRRRMTHTLPGQPPQRMPLTSFVSQVAGIPGMNLNENIADVIEFMQQNYPEFNSWMEQNNWTNNPHNQARRLLIEAINSRAPGAAQRIGGWPHEIYRLPPDIIQRLRGTQQTPLNAR